MSENRPPVSEYVQILPCGCKKSPGPMGAWWACAQHERPSGYWDWAAYARAWKDTRCVQCNRRGFWRGDDFEMVQFPAGYAHTRCAVEGRRERGIAEP